MGKDNEDIYLGCGTLYPSCLDSTQANQFCTIVQEYTLVLDLKPYITPIYE